MTQVTVPFRTLVDRASEGALDFFGGTSFRMDTPRAEKSSVPDAGAGRCLAVNMSP